MINIYTVSNTECFALKDLGSHFQMNERERKKYRYVSFEDVV